MQSTTAGSLERELSEFWWVFLLRGIISIIFGLLLISSPGITMFSIIVFLGMWFLIDGIFSIVSIFLKNRVTPWGWLLLQGILGILAGLYILRYPLVSTVLVPSLIVESPCRG